ncbi:MAG: triose-phosphate isomerase [Chloroflexi bacterium]|nr:triose-phosphate isomerase [Chloroflexota bacterium]
MRPVLIVANWKMNTTPADAGDLAVAIAAATDEPAVGRVICPPFVSLQPVRDALAGSGVEVGAQDLHHEVSGAYTGDISASMLEGLVSWCIVGHSERRRDHGETDERIGHKLARCREAGIRPILCVGEQLQEREAGRAIAVVGEQLRRTFEASARMDERLVIAYEPVWAIGTGLTARGADAAEMAEAIRQALGELGYGARAAEVPVLYGGSVTSASIGEFLAEPTIDGALVGGASLKVDEMAGIVARAALTARARQVIGETSSGAGDRRGDP